MSDGLAAWWRLTTNWPDLVVTQLDWDDRANRPTRTAWTTGDRRCWVGPLTSTAVVVAIVELPLVDSPGVGACRTAQTLRTGGVGVWDCVHDHRDGVAYLCRYFRTVSERAFKNTQRVAMATLTLTSPTVHQGWVKYIDALHTWHVPRRRTPPV